MFSSVIGDVDYGYDTRAYTHNIDQKLLALIISQGIVTCLTFDFPLFRHLLTEELFKFWSKVGHIV